MDASSLFKPSATSTPRVPSSANRSVSSLSANRTTLSATTAYGSNTKGPSTFVINMGTRLTRIGIAGEYAPQEVFRTAYIDPTRPSLSHHLYDSKRDPDEQERILAAFFKEIIMQKLLKSPINSRVVIVDNLFSTPAFRDLCAKALFKNPSLSASAISFVPAPLMNLITLNVRTALLIDTGIKEALLYLIFERVVLFYEFDATPCSTAMVEDRVRELMSKYGRVEAFDGSERELTDDDLKLFDQLRYAEDICYRFCFATTRERSLASTEKEGFDFAPSVKLPFGSEMLIVPGIVRETAADIVFMPDHEARSIPQLIVEFIHRAPIEVKRQYLKSLLFVGGLSNMKGFLSRMREEIVFLLEDAYDGRYAAMKEDVAFYTHPEPSATKFCPAWIGASLIAANDINPWYTKSQWDDNSEVPDWTNDFDDYFSKMQIVDENFRTYEEQPELIPY